MFTAVFTPGESSPQLSIRFHNRYSTLNNSRVIKSGRKLYWASRTNGYMGKLERDYLGDLGVDGNNFKSYLKDKQGVRVWTEIILVKTRPRSWLA